MQTERKGMSRRNALKTAGAAGIASLIGLTGSAAAARPEKEEKGKGNNFGNGNGIGVFLNEEAEYKDSPVWSGGMVNRKGQENVEVVVGAMTSVDIDAPFDELPVSFAPQGIVVSPGTTVTWTWPVVSGAPPIPHDVVSLDKGLFDSGLRFPGAPDFSYTFDERGTYLYYCTPHGAPFEVHEMGNPNLPLVYNEFGMRGVVKVAGR